jgi:hypothetical protein
MFPFIFEWVDDPSHYVFMIPFYTVLIALFVIVNICGIGALIKWACKTGDNGHGDTEHH